MDAVRLANLLLRSTGGLGFDITYVLSRNRSMNANVGVQLVYAIRYPIWQQTGDVDQPIRGCLLEQKKEREKEMGNHATG